MAACTGNYSIKTPSRGGFQEPALLAKRVERTQEHRRLVVLKGWRHIHVLIVQVEEIHAGAEVICLGVQCRSSKSLPFSGRKSSGKSLHRGNSFCWSEGAVPCAMDKQITHQRLISSFTRGGHVGLFVFDRHKSIAHGVHSEYGNGKLAIEDDVLDQV